jgi:SAM-dependent methyltransferase
MSIPAPHHFCGRLLCQEWWVWASLYGERLPDFTTDCDVEGMGENNPLGPAPGSFDCASLRDPGGKLVFVRGEPIRFVRSPDAATLRRFLESSVARDWTAAGALVMSFELDERQLNTYSVEPLFSDSFGAERWAGVWRHERVFFPSSVEEWTPSMLQQSGVATLDLACALLKDGRGLKDATPRNVLFRGARPVFVDLLSIEERDPTDPLWLPYAQFLRTFINPLLVSKATGLPLRAIFNLGREGVEPEEVRALVPLSHRLAGPGLWHVTLPTMLLRARPNAVDGVQPKRAVAPEQAHYVLRRLFKGLRRSLRAVAPVESASAWTGYTEEHHNERYFAAKHAFVSAGLKAFHPQTVLDIGCNTGDLSVVAAKYGAQVVAIDNDPGVVERLFRRAVADELNILPLIVDVSAPTPARGWMNQEWPSFLDRAAGAFDVVLAMAVLHHLLATNGIPLPRIIDLLAVLTRGAVILEFVPPSDPLFRQLARGRDHLFADISRKSFEEACGRRFRIVRTESLPSGQRVGYVLEKHS